MRSLMIVLVVAACGKTSTPTPENTGSGTAVAGDAGAAKPAVGSGSAPGSGADIFDQAIARLDTLKTQMCACKDAACAGKVMEDYKTWRMDMKKSTHGMRPTKPQDERGNALDKEFRACRVTAEGAVTAVGSGSGSASGDPLDVALGEYEAFKTKMCACTDKACSDKVQADVAAWERAVRTKVTAKPNSVQKLRGQAIETGIKDCRKKAEAATPGAAGGSAKIDAMLVKMAAFRDKTCACKDKACIEAIDKEVSAWQQQIAKDLSDAKPTKEQDDKADKLVGEMKACVQKIK